MFEERRQPIVVGPAPATSTLLEAAPANPAFDSRTGRALPGNKSLISDPLLRVYNALQDSKARLSPLDFPIAERLQLDDSGAVMVTVTAVDVTTLEPQLQQIGFRTLGSAAELHTIEGWLPVTNLPQAEALRAHGLLGVVPIRRPGTSLGLVTSQADWAAEADRVRSTVPPAFIDGSGVRIGVLSDSFNTRVAPITNAAQDVANGDLPAVTVLQEGPAASSDEGRAMLQLIHDVATGSPLSFASAFFGQVDFGNQIKALQASGASVIVDDIFYFEEPQYQDGVIAQAITDVVNNKNVAYYSSAGNNGTDVYESVGWTETNADPFSTRLFDFDPGPGVDARQRITIGLNADVNITFQWDDPFYTVAGVDTDMDIYLIRSDTGAIVASGLDVNPTTQVPSENFGYTNNTGQTAFDIIIRRFSGPNPGRFKWVNLNNSGSLTINEFDPGVAGSITPHAAATAAEGVGATPYFDQLGIEGFTSRGPNVVVFDTAGNPIAAQNRTGVYIAAFDGVNTTFFGGDTEGDGFRNFFGTSAAAPNAAAIAAMYRQANPAAGPYGVYAALENSADSNVFTPGFDTRTGFGLVNAYDAIVGFTQARETNLFDGFESSLLGRQWETHSTGAGRIEVSSANTPASGTYHVTLDSDFDSHDSRNELILHVNLANVNNAVLTFQEKEFSDEDDAMPASFVGSGDFDGVALSVDGTNWYRLVSLTGTSSTGVYQSFSFNLHKVAADNGLTLNSNTRIKFQQFDNFGITTDGIAFDDIQIFRTGNISGISYDDLNVNGIRDGAEPGRPGQIVYVDANSNNQFDYGNAIKFTSAQLPVVIGGADTYRIPITVSGFGGTVSDVDVTVDLTMTWDGDLDMYLVGPNGTRVELSTGNGFTGDNYTNTTFDDEAATGITAGAAPFTGRFQPEGFLGAEDGNPLSGNWYLEITDTFPPGDVATLNSWSLTLSRNFISADVPKAIPDVTTVTSILNVGGLAGVMSDVDITLDITHTYDADLDIFLTGPGGVKVELTTDNGFGVANFSNTTFDDEAAISITAGAAPYAGRFRPEGKLSDFDGLSPNATWTLTIIDDAGGDVGTLNSWSLTIGRSFSQDDAPVPIPDLATATSKLPVTNLSGPIQDVEVSLNLTHTFDGDLEVFLTSPAGTKVELINREGGSSDNFTGTFLDDAATIPVYAGLGPFSGAYRPDAALSAFNGQDPNGIWTLTVMDDAGADVGAIVDWAITLHTAASVANTSPVSIADYKTSYSSVFFSGVTGTVNDVNVTLNITHTFDNDLDIYLIAPGGARVELTTDNGGSNDNFTNTTFDDEVATGIQFGAAPFSGTFHPEGQLSLFDGINPNGVWTLEITDDLGGDIGTLNSWSVTLSTGELFAVTGTKGEYELPNLGLGSYRIREVLPAGRRHTQPVPDTYVESIDNAAATNLTLRDFGSVVDVTAPMAKIVPISPDPRNVAVPSINIVFSEPVNGFNTLDLVLSRDGGPNLLTGAETLSTLDNVTWTLSGLAGLTATQGNYAVSLNGFGSGIIDRALNGFTGFAADDWVMDTTAPTVTLIQINDGSIQRSLVKSITVTFSELVNLPGVPATAFKLARTGPGAPMSDVTIASVDTTGSTPTQTIATLTFSGALTEFKSLIDGKYDFTVFGASFTDNAGNAGVTANQSLHRLFGDADGNATVNSTDFAAFRSFFGLGSSIFDFNDDLLTNSNDFAEFRKRFGLML